MTDTRSTDAAILAWLAAIGAGARRRARRRCGLSPRAARARGCGRSSDAGLVRARSGCCTARRRCTR